jgi:hypothetical protein
MVLALAFWPGHGRHGAHPEFGRVPNGNAVGQDKQYGQPAVALGLLEDAGPIMRNPNCSHH